MSLNHYLNDFSQLLSRIDQQEVENLIDAITEAYDNDQFVFIIGNGGSGANASHLCEDSGSALTDFDNQKRLKVLSLTDNTPAILALANDTDYERVFVEQLKISLQPGSLLIAISGSGNSPNVLAVRWNMPMKMASEPSGSGCDGGRLKHLASRISMFLFDMGAVESVHMVLFHYVLNNSERTFQGIRMSHAVGIEIGGTKLQMGLGLKDGKIIHIARDQVDPTRGAEGIRTVIPQLMDDLLQKASLAKKDISGIGVGFGGPVNSRTGITLKSLQIQGWDKFPANLAGKTVFLPCNHPNDASTAGYAEAMIGAGRGFSRVFYMTIGSGIGGGWIRWQN